MKFRNPTVRMPAPGKILFFLPVILFLLVYTVSSVHSLHRLRSLDSVFDSLFSGRDLSSREESFLVSLSSDELQSYVESWPAPRRDAAYLILGYQGIFPAPHPGETLQPVSAEPDEILLSATDQLINRDDPGAAEKLLREYWLLHFYSSDMPPKEEIFDRVRRVVLRTNTAEFWIDFLSGWRGFSDAGFEAAFLLASCYEKTQSWKDALFWYEHAGLRSDHWEELRRSNWYRMRLIIRTSPDMLPDFLDSAGILKNDDAYFDDILDDYFSVLVRERSWSELSRILPFLMKAGLSGPASQGKFLLNRAREEGECSLGNPSADVDGFSYDPKGYYALRAYPETWPHILTSDNQLNKGDEAGKPGNVYFDDLLNYLFKAGYKKEAYLLWKEDQPELSLATVISVCRYLEGEGDLYELIIFAGYWYYIYPIESALKLLPWVFPGAERYELADGAVPGELILGIIRRESAFHETISSRVGAGGLMQLMPSTAADLARKYRLSDWDLMKAEDNILLGTLYLQWLQERPWTTSFIDVLAAYNGGGGNLRSWKNQHSYADPDLFIQSIPYRETRDYVRKVIVAAASYRYLETGVPPGDWLEQFYSSF